jgi:hypothetical protein
MSLSGIYKFNSRDERLWNDRFCGAKRSFAKLSITLVKIAQESCETTSVDARVVTTALGGLDGS